jgi:putative oxygen-independent coproporphyrinogen III oxidase
MVPSAALPGIEPPQDGRLPSSVVVGARERTLGLYVHIPFCAVRCGYCDFNTYTATELKGVTHDSYPISALAEMDFAHTAMAASGLPQRQLSSIFFGGGTPTLLGPKPIIAMLNRARELWGVGDDVEITIEANPDSVTGEDLAQLAEAGVTRVSVGVQSVVPSVLATLDRTHAPELVPEVVEQARSVGLGVSVDLIFGSPGETLEQWDTTVRSAVELAPDHISAYALIVEPGTALARRIARGELQQPDDDLHADMYAHADGAFTHAGYRWYEISNWATSSATESRHNRSYWTTNDWWGIGPGAHSHVGGTRWWNVKHPSAYVQRLAQGHSPAQAREILTPEEQSLERILLGLRVREGIPASWVRPEKAPVIAALIGRGFLDGPAALAGQLVVTQAGRLMADHIVRELS